jgi:hypothetical protein
MHCLEERRLAFGKEIIDLFRVWFEALGRTLSKIKADECGKR